MSSVDSATDRLIQEAGQHLARRDPAGALELLRRAEAGGVTIDSALNRAVAHRMSGDLNAALVALDDALAIDAYEFMALLSKAAVIEQMAGPRQATPHYRNAIKIAPPRERCPPGLKAQLEHGDRLVAGEAEALRDRMRAAVASVSDSVGDWARERFEEGLDIFAGLKRPAPQEPLLLHYPGLPAISFYDRDLFPWLPELEAATDMIRGELERLLAASADEFAPYIAYPRGAPVNQWGELNHSKRWSSAFLWKDGERQDAACAQCPQTTALLERLPMAHQSGFAPTAVFSALEAQTHIPAHTGSSNVRLLTHLPLILPGPARFRVGNTERSWRMGEAWVFDDTIEHEAWNDADELRVILIFDVWNPYITEGERARITAMMQAKRDFEAGR